jgi:CheY-like chemotaxis protein
VVVTSCHNCVDGLNDLIKHYELDCEVKQLVNLVANALVLDEVEKPTEEPAPGDLAVATVAAKEPLAGRKILVVDDEEDVRAFLTMVFEDAGAEVITATDGDEAIAMASEHKPDLISLDLSMPGKDGVEAFVELRKNPETEEIPVCVVTGHPEFRQVIYDRVTAWRRSSWQSPNRRASSNRSTTGTGRRCPVICRYTTRISGSSMATGVSGRTSVSASGSTVTRSTRGGTRSARRTEPPLGAAAHDQRWARGAGDGPHHGDHG